MTEKGPTKLIKSYSQNGSSMYMNFEKISNHCAAFLHKFSNFHYNFACVREENGVQVQGKD